MKNIMITIIPNFKFKGQAISVGENLQLKQAPDNEHDPLAVAVYRNLDLVGYVSANCETILNPDMCLASKLFKSLNNQNLAEAWVKVVDEGFIQTKNGKQMIVWGGSCSFIPKRSDTNANSVEEVIAGGSIIGNAMKTDLLLEMQKSIKAGAALPILYATRITTPNGKTIVKTFRNKGDSIITNSCGEIAHPSENLKAMLNRNEYVILQATDVCLRNGSPVAEGVAPEAFKASFSIETGKSKTIIDAIDKVAREGRGRVTEIEEKANFLSKQGVPENVILSVLDAIDVVNDDSLQSMVPCPETPFEQQGSLGELTRALAYRISGLNIRLVGDKGSGKNTLTETVDWILNQPQYRLQGNAELDKLDLLGSPSLNNGTMTYQLSDMLQCLINGGDVVLDEGNTIRPEVADLLHSLTDGARQIAVPGYGLVKMHPKASITLTMNEGYMGTTRMNEATVDRFTPIIMSQPDSLKAILQKCCPNVSECSLTICERVYSAIRGKISGGGNTDGLDSDCMTIRGFIDALKVESLVGLKLALLDNVAKKPQDEYSRIQLTEIIEAYL